MVSKHVLTVLLALTCSLAIVSGSLGINSLVKSGQQSRRLKNAAPSGVTVNIDYTDILSAGYVLTIGNGLLALASLVFLVQTFFSSKATTARRHAIRAGILGFLTLWCFASVMAVLILARTRSAKVTAFLGAIQLPAVLVQQQEAALGSSPVYWTEKFLRAGAIVPWFAVLFGALATAALLSARPAVVEGSHSDEKLSAPAHTEQMA